MVTAPKTRVSWSETHRLTLSHYPPIDLFDDLVDPKDWEALALAESRTNPQIYEDMGDLSLVPVDRRISGPGASWVMAAFTHISPDRTSRFSERNMARPKNSPGSKSPVAQMESSTPASDMSVESALLPSIQTWCRRQAREITLGITGTDRTSILCNRRLERS